MDQDSTRAGRLTRRTALLTTGAAGLAALGLGACAAGSSTPTTATSAPAAGGTEGATGLEEMAQKAKAEGSVNVYSAAPQNATEQLAKEFTAKYGVAVNITRLVSSPLAARFSAEAQTGQVVADTLQMSDVTFMSRAMQEGWLVKLDNATVPAARDWPARFQQNNTIFVQALALESILYNTQLAKGSDAPTRWEDLLNPMWKGKIMLVDVRSAANALGWLYYMRTTYGDSFVQRLGAQDLKLIDSTTTGANSVAAGDVVMLAPSNHWSNTPLIEQGAPIVDAHPAPNTGVEQWMGAAKNPPHPNASLLYMNFALSVPGQVVECKDLCSSVLDAPGTLKLPEGYVSPPIDEAAAQKNTLLALLGLH